MFNVGCVTAGVPLLPAEVPPGVLEEAQSAQGAVDQGLPARPRKGDGRGKKFRTPFLFFSLSVGFRLFLLRALIKGALQFPECFLFRVAARARSLRWIAVA